MAQSFDPEPLKAFFQEVKEQLGIQLKYLPDNPKYPIQLDLTNLEDGIAKNKCVEILQFIKTQVDFRDNEIGIIHPSKTTGKFLIDITKDATRALADVYALSFFYPHEESQDSQDSENLPIKNDKAKKTRPKPQKNDS